MDSEAGRAEEGGGGEEEGAALPATSRDEWFWHERNVFGPGYDHAAKNRGLRLRLTGDTYYSLVQAILRPPR